MFAGRAAINFILVAAVVYFLVVMPYNRLRKRGEVEQAQDTESSLLTEIRDLLSENGAKRPASPVCMTCRGVTACPTARRRW